MYTHFNDTASLAQMYFTNIRLYLQGWGEFGWNLSEIKLQVPYGSPPCMYGDQQETKKKWQLEIQDQSEGIFIAKPPVGVGGVWSKEDEKNEWIP